MSVKTVVGRKPKIPLKIAIDAGSLAAPAKHQGGIARICQTLVQFLPRLDRRNFYFIYTFKKLNLDLPEYSQSRVKQRVLPQRGFSKIWFPLWLKIDKPDIILAVSQYLPEGSYVALGFVYDLAFLQPRFKKTSRRGLADATEKLVRYAKHLLTFSQFTKKAVIKNFHIDPFKISVAAAGVSLKFRSQGAKIFSDKPYFLYVGAFKPAKNLPLLLRAFQTFLKDTNLNFRLILAGEMGSPKPIQQMIKQLALEKHVQLTGYVSDTNLAKYYRGAFAFVSPSLLEGFGFSFLEAMASGTPVIAGNNSAMKEVVGKAGILVDARSYIEIAQAMKQLVADKDLYQQLSRAGRVRAGKYHEQKLAKKVLNIINTKLL